MNCVVLVMCCVYWQHPKNVKKDNVVGVSAFFDEDDMALRRTEIGNEKETWCYSDLGSSSLTAPRSVRINLQLSGWSRSWGPSAPASWTRLERHVSRMPYISHDLRACGREAGLLYTSRPICQWLLHSWQQIHVQFPWWVIWECATTQDDNLSWKHGHSRARGGGRGREHPKEDQEGSGLQRLLMFLASLDYIVMKMITISLFIFKWKGNILDMECDDILCGYLCSLIWAASPRRPRRSR